MCVFGVWGGVGGVVVVVGLVFGGFFILMFGWFFVFLVNVFFGILGVIFLVCYLLKMLGEVCWINFGV